MTAIVQAPREMIEAVADLRLPPKTDRLLQALMDRNSEGTLSTEEKEELAALVELSETISLMRGKALFILGKQPPCSPGAKK